VFAADEGGKVILRDGEHSSSAAVDGPGETEAAQAGIRIELHQQQKDVIDGRCDGPLQRYAQQVYVEASESHSDLRLAATRQRSVWRTRSAAASRLNDGPLCAALPQKEYGNSRTNDNQPRPGLLRLDDE